MPNLRRSQVYETLIAPLSVDDGPALFAAVLDRSGVTDRPLFRPEDVSRLGEALMAMAREQAQYGMQEA